jgi:hypothetical protein
VDLAVACAVVALERFVSFLVFSRDKRMMPLCSGDQ